MPNWLVPPMQITLLSQIEYIFVFFLSFIWKITSLNGLKIMKKCPITEYNVCLVWSAYAMFLFDKGSFMWRPIFTSSVFWWAGHFSMSFDWLAAKVECDWLLFGMWRVQKATLCLCHHFRENLDFHWSIPNQKRSINSIALNFTYILLNKIQWLPQSGGL